MVLLGLVYFEGLEAHCIFSRDFLWLRLLKFSSVRSGLGCLRLSLPLDVEWMSFFYSLGFGLIGSFFYYFLGLEGGRRADEVLRVISGWDYLVETMVVDFLRVMSLELIMGVDWEFKWG